MDKNYEPPRRRSLIFNLSLGFFALVGALTLLVLGAGTAGSDHNRPFIVLAAILLGVVTFLSYRVFLILTTRYLLTPSSLDLRWGFQRELIPIDRVEWAHPLSDFDSPMPLPGFLVPFQYYGKRKIRGLGLVEFAATYKQNMVLIRADDRHFVISPVDPHAFAEDIGNVSSLGMAETVEPASQNLRLMTREIIRDATAKNLLIAGLLSVLLLLIVTVALSATRINVTWITLELVPSSRLLLLALVGALDWLLNTFLGGYFFLRGLLEKRWICLFWSWSILICLVLSAASVFMSIGNA